MDAPRFTVSIPAESRYLKAIRSFFETALGAAIDEETDMIVLALDEACSNVLKHGSRCAGELIRVAADVLPGLLRVRVDDFCAEDDVLRIKPRDLTDVRPGGLGTHFVSSIMDRVEFVREPGRPGRMALVLEKSLGGART